jgi:hypothetical protein
MYETCQVASSPDGCAGRLPRIGQAGFRVVANGSMLNGATAQQVVAYTDAAEAAGLQVIWPLYGIDFASSSPGGTNLLGSAPNLAATCSCTDNQGLLAYVISLARSRSNTWGYYLADEPGPDAYTPLQSLIDRVKALDPGHPRLVMGCGVCSPQDPRNNLPFLSGLDISLGTDVYPVRDQAPNPRAAYDGVAQAATSLQRNAASAGRRTVIALQAWRWGDSYYDSQGAGFDPARTRFPTQQEIQAQRDAAIAYAHPSLILWFTLYDVTGWNGNERPWYWADPSDPQQRWNNLVQGAFATPAGPQSAVLPTAAERSATAGKPVPRFTVRVTRPPARIGTRVVLDGRRSYDPAGKRLRYRWTLNGHRLPNCPARLCSFRPHRSGTQRIALLIDSGGQTAASVKRLHVKRRQHRTRPRNH